MNTAEYKNLQTRKFLAERIIAVFMAMSQNDDIKVQAIDSIYNGITTCDDRIISALDEIELLIRIAELENGNFSEEELRKIGKSLLLLEMINDKAKEHVESLRFVDELEVYLAFQIGLKERFGLPLKTTHMIFRRCAQISDEGIQTVGDSVEEACTDELLNEFLETWGPWVSYQRKNSIPQYEELPFSDEAPAENDKCLITFGIPENPVIYNGVLYDYDALKVWIQDSGKNPMNPDEDIDLSQLKRIQRKK